jgi:hypothetical protein
VENDWIYFEGARGNGFIPAHLIPDFGSATDAARIREITGITPAWCQTTEGRTPEEFAAIIRLQTINLYPKK